LNRLQRWESGPYFAAFSLHIPDMCVEIVKICARSPNVSLSNTQVRQAPSARDCFKMEFYLKRIATMTTAENTVSKAYMCLICGFIYDEAAGLPDEGIAPGTRWDDVPINWVCPECGARKDDFELIEI
jgi:rubredoxin